MNTMTINGYQAVISFDPDLQMFRGRFVGLNGGADFYAKDVVGLRHEGGISLRSLP
ncbi:MAG: type II toxin-antitoxin system HicB family antitoxin [Gammaproteobacteria bacterium]|nr:type II toxin-antitoxin system HicB family antitoxin [Gammaproteobacteria bacterium]